MALAIEETGKYVSERHAEATDAGKRTAGQMAAMLNRKFKPQPKVTAAELKAFADEWHHSGFHKGSRGSTMGRTYFFKADADIDRLFERVCIARSEQAAVEAEGDVERFFFIAAFERVQVSRFGKLGYKPVAKFEAITCKPGRQFAKKTEIGGEDYDLLKDCEGERLEPYESFTHFKERMLKNAGTA